MARVELPFTNGFYLSKSLPLSAQRCLNWYINISETGTLSRENLFGTPGIKQLIEGKPLEPERGGHEFKERPYFVKGNRLYRLDRTVNPDTTETFSETDLGFIEGTGRVSMADNGQQLCIVVPGGRAYVFEDVGDTLVEITDPDFNGPAETVVFLDGYFVFNKTNSNVIFHSELRDGLSYNALDFAEAEADPDNTVALWATGGTLYVLGTETIEPYSNVGGLEFVFAPIPNGEINKGLRSTFAIQRAGNTFAFLGSGQNEEESIYIFTGNSVQKISTEPLDTFLQNLSPEQLDEAFCNYYSKDGHDFWSITVGTNTFSFGPQASRLAGRLIWGERTSRRDDGQDQQWRVSSIVNAYNRPIVGDTRDGRIGELQSGLYEEYGNPIIRTVVIQPFDNDGNPIFVSAIEAIFQNGVGDCTNDPLVGLDWSDDGGRTWSDKIFLGLGKCGEYERRTIWRRLGRFPLTRVLRFHFSEAVPAAFLKLWADAA